MKIEDKRHAATAVAIEKIPTYKTFEYSNSIYMKIGEDYDCVTAVNLSSQSLSNIGYGIMVTPVKCKLIVEE